MTLLQKAQIRDYEQRLELIQEEYLQKHFQQVAIVLAKHYHYAFQLLKQLYRLTPSKVRVPGKVLSETVGRIMARRKKTNFAYLVRRDEENQYLKSKACIVLTCTSINTKHFLSEKSSARKCISSQQSHPKTAKDLFPSSSNCSSSSNYPTSTSCSPSRRQILST